jgi:hypothetical protein
MSGRGCDFNQALQTGSFLFRVLDSKSLFDSALSKKLLPFCSASCIPLISSQVKSVRKQRADTSPEAVTTCAKQWWTSQTRPTANKKNVKKDPKNKKESHHVQWLETTAWNFYQHWLKHYTMYYPNQVSSSFQDAFTIFLERLL